ncbi:MAG: VOC family protein [Propionibacteriaceae bacterium]|nr:VOC family protein [Propionibacteriaceae bacterium]
MGILRLGYAHIRVTDLEAAKRHYIYTMGLRPTLEVGNRVYLKGWDEWDHHSVVLEEGGVGVVKVGFKVAKVEDLDDIEAKARTFGVTTERMSKGDNPEVSDGLRFFLPSMHTIEVYHEQTLVGLEVGDVNPFPFPRDLMGIGVPRLDHALLGCDEVNTSEQFFIDVFGMFPVERLVPDMDHQDVSVATWLSNGNRTHDIALIGGENYSGKLHHIAFQLEDWNAILRAGQIMAIDDVPVDLGPTQHNITRGKTIYYFDPAGNRNEVFADGYVAQRDRPCVLWSLDLLGRGLSTVDRNLNETFLTVFS